MILDDFRRRPAAAVAMITLISLGIALGVWQLKRAAYKEELAIEFEKATNANPLLVNDPSFKEAAAIHQKIQARGFYIQERGIWLENRPHPLGRDPQTGIATGFYLLMPLRVSSDSKKILWVNRGWAPRHFEKLNQVPTIQTPNEEVVIQGVAVLSPSKTFALGKESGLRATDGLPIQENLDLKVEQQKGAEPQFSFIFRQDDQALKDGLQRQWPKPDSGIQKHYGYAFQWFALALMTFVFWAITAYRAHRKSLR